MPNITKTLKYLAAIVPLIVLLGSVAIWIDARYMHKSISDTRHIDLQIMIVQGHIRDYERLVDLDKPITAADQRNYQLDLATIQNLKQERARLLGIGG